MFRYVLRCILICIVFLQLKTTTKKSLNCKTCACLPFQAYEIASAGLADGREAMWPTISHLAFALTAATQPRVVVAVQPPAFGGQPAARAVQLWKKLANLDSCLSSKKALRRWKLHCRESRMSISLTSTPELSSRSPSWSSILLIGASTFWKRTKNEQLWSRDTRLLHTTQRTIFRSQFHLDFIFCLPNLIHSSINLVQPPFPYSYFSISNWFFWSFWEPNIRFGYCNFIRNSLLLTRINKTQHTQKKLKWW